MSASTTLLVDAFGRVREAVHQAVDGLSTDDLAYRVDPDANPIAWLVWHLTRVQDDHVAALAARGQAWTVEGWAGRFGLPFPEEETGYGMTSEQVGKVRGISAELLTGYHDDVYQRSVDYLETLGDDDFDRVVDERWDPPVTLGVRLISVVAEDNQHAGQAAYVRGLLLRRP